MKIVSKANNKNNSRATIEFQESGVLSRAGEIAKKHGCGLSHNVTTKPVSFGDEVKFPSSFGTVSFNKGEHMAALKEFLKESAAKKHFIALVKMEGEHEGKIGQHSTMQEDEQGAIDWAKGRFSRPFAIVEMSDPNQLSLDTQKAEEIYNTYALHSNEQ